MTTSLNDALSGTKVVLFVHDGANYILIGGQTAHSKTLTFEPIDITNKSDADVRTYLEGEGKKTADVTAEVLFSTDAAYELLQQKYDDKEFALLRIRYVADLSRVDDFKVLITAISEPAEQNTAVTSSVTFSNTDAFSINQDLS